MPQQQAGTSEAPGETARLPSWTPEPVREIIREIDRSILTFDDRAVLVRLALDPRMQKVWGELLKLDRRSGKYRYPALRREQPSLHSADDFQFAALREVFHFAFRAACDKRSVTKPQEILQNKELLLEKAELLRILAHDLDLARKSGKYGLADLAFKELTAEDVSTLHRMANWLEGIASSLRRPDDILSVKKQRGDPIIRAVLILIANQLETLFGSRLDGTAATLTNIALNAKISPRAARSALTKAQSQNPEAPNSPKP